MITGKILVLGLACFLLIFRKKIYPPFFLFLFLFFDYKETLGVYGAVNFVALHRILRAFFLASTFISFIKLYKERYLNRTNRQLFQLGLMLVFYMLWTYASRMLFDLSDYLYLFFSGTDGPFAMIIVFAYYKDKLAQKIFLFYIYIQLALATLVLAFPSSFLDSLRGVNYFTKWLDFDPRTAMDLSATNELIGSRFSGQFSNAVQLSFYVAIGVALSVYLITVSKRFITRILGVFLFCMSVWLLLVTNTRGAFLGIVVGYACMLLVSKIPKLYLALAFSIISIFIAFNWDKIYSLPVFEPIFKRMENTSLYEGGVNYRLMAIDQFKERFPESPLFGFGDYDLTVSKLTGYMPHQAPLEIAAVHGLIPAVILTILLILGILPMFKKMKINRFKRNNYQESEAFFNNDIFGLCIVFGWVVFFIAFTNKMAGQTLTWIALAIAVLPIFISIDNHNRQIPPVART